MFYEGFLQDHGRSVGGVVVSIATFQDHGCRIVYRNIDVLTNGYLIEEHVFLSVTINWLEVLRRVGPF